MTGFQVIIPARYDSTRLPGKVLRPIAGRALIEHVHRVARAAGPAAVHVATDDERVAAACRGFGARVLMTSAAHTTGTDRIAECVERLGLADEVIVVNLQGDEPLTPPAALVTVAQALEREPEAAVATLCTGIVDSSEVRNPNAVKVVFDQRGMALYFSRAPIPFQRDRVAADGGPPGLWFRHLGVYAYRAGFLKKAAALAPAPAEQAEKLEQLRWLHHGARIHVSVVAQAIPPGVDTEEDLARVARVLSRAEEPKLD